MTTVNSDILRDASIEVEAQISQKGGNTQGGEHGAIHLSWLGLQLGAD